MTKQNIINLFSLTTLILILALPSCKSKKESNKIFLDFYLGMSADEYRYVKDSLIKNNKITHANGDYCNYIFNLPNGKNAETRFSPNFYNGFLESLKIEFGSLYNYQFSNLESADYVMSVLQMYYKKYGSAKMDKGRFTVKYGEEKEYDIYKWDRGDYDISFFLGEKEKSVSSGTFGETYYFYTGGFIEYKLNDEERNKLNRKKSDSNLKDI